MSGRSTVVNRRGREGCPWRTTELLDLRPSNRGDHPQRDPSFYETLPVHTRGLTEDVAQFLESGDCVRSETLALG